MHGQHSLPYTPDSDSFSQFHFPTHYTPPTPKDNLMKFVTQNESAMSNEHLHRTTKD